MALHVDLPTRKEVGDLLEARDPASVSIYLPTTPVTPDAEADRIAFGNAASDAVAELEQAGVANSDVGAIEEELAELRSDEAFWALQAHSLAIFATPTSIRTLRLPNRLEQSVTISDRFHVKPLLRAVTFPQEAFVLALAQGSVRLLEVSPDLPPHEVVVPDLPSDAASAAGKASIADRSPSGAVQGSEGQKLRMRQYARKVDSALRGVLTGLEVPLILAATQPIDSIYRSVCTYPHLAERTIEGNPEATSDADIAVAARGILDQVYAAELAELASLFEVRANAGRGITDLGDVARAATFGAVDTVIVDIDADPRGEINEETGAVTEGEGYGLVDEIARRVIASGGRVVAVRSDDVPHGGSAAAILRYTV